MSALPLETVRSTPGPLLEVDLGAVGANTRLLADRVGRGGLTAVVKADGFGLGATAVARTALAHGAARLGVATLGEALALRADGVDAPLLSWLNPVDAAWDRARDAGVAVAVPSRDHLAALPVGSTVHLHLDTQMARDGAAPEEWADLCRAAARAERTGRVRVAGVMGHLATADVPGHPATPRAVQRFAWGVAVARAAGLRPAERHLAATAAVLLDPAGRHAAARVGAGLVGIDPTGAADAHGLVGALRLSAPLVTVRRVPAGTGVGYGHTWTAPRATWLGLVPLGYADGLPRVASGRASVLVGRRRRPLVGRISMDSCVVDLGPAPHAWHAPGVRPGDRVVVLGPGGDGEPTASDWAAWSDTLPHELLTGLGPRPTRTPSGALR